MTEFGFHSESSNPARQRIEAAGLKGQRAAIQEGRVLTEPAPWRAPTPPLPMMRIAMEVAREYGVTVADLKGPSRKRRFVVPRQEAMWRCLTELPKTSTEVGRFFGRDHTVALYGKQMHEERLRCQSSA